MDNKYTPGQIVASGGVFAALSTMAFEFFQNPENVTRTFGAVANSQIAQAGFFFTVAAWLHAGRVKKEISSNFAHLTKAIDNVSLAFREDLARHSEKLEKNALELANLSSRVQNVEYNLNIKKE